MSKRTSSGVRQEAVVALQHRSVYPLALAAVFKRFAVPALLLLAASGEARADIQTKGAQLYPGKHEITTQIGFQTGIGGYSSGGSSPGGFKLMGDYNYRVWEREKLSLWIDVGFGLTLGGGCTSAFVSPQGVGAYSCSLLANGDTIDLLAGVKLKFKVTEIPLVPYARANMMVNYIFNRYCTDQGVGVGPRVAGGVKYFVTRGIGLGVETGFTLGAGIYHGAPSSDANCLGKGYTYPAHNEFYGTWDFMLGGEFAF